MKEEEFYRLYAQYDKIIIKLEQKVLTYKMANQKVDTTEQEETINGLIFLRTMFHKLWHINLTLDKGEVEVIMEREKLLNKINRLEKENRELKENVNF